MVRAARLCTLHGVISALMSRLCRIALPMMALALTACAAQPPDGAHDAPAVPVAAPRPVLYDSLGGYSYRITTTSADAQRWFDQGLRLIYAFNHHEAQKAFLEAARLDPKCAMCFWGTAAPAGCPPSPPAPPRSAPCAPGPSPPPRAPTTTVRRTPSARSGRWPPCRAP